MYSEAEPSIADSFSKMHQCTKIFEMVNTFFVLLIAAVQSANEGYPASYFQFQSFYSCW